MDMLNATDVRKNWSVTLDSVVREKPAYVKRTHDNIAIIGVQTLNTILSGYRFNVKRFNEEDGSVTLSSEEMDIIANGPDENSALRRMAAYIKEYAEEFYDEFPTWSAAPNRKSHIPYVFKALSLNIDEILEDIVCQDGKN